MSTQTQIRNANPAIRRGRGPGAECVAKRRRTTQRSGAQAMFRREYLLKQSDWSRKGLQNRLGDKRLVGYRWNSMVRVMWLATGLPSAIAG